MREEVTYGNWCCLAVVSQISAHPGWGIETDNGGHIYFSDVQRNIIWRVDPDGGLHPLLSGVHSHQLFLTEDG